MRKLNLSMNRLQSLPKLDLPDLEWLSLARNQLGEIVTFHFDGLPKLAHLDLSGNRLKTILELKLPSLEWLSLARNRLNTLSTFRAGMLPKLTHINLSWNNLRTIPDLSLPSLEWLSLARNKLDKLPEFHAEDLPVLAHFDLSYNNLINVIGALAPLCAKVDCLLKTLDLRGNSSLVLPGSEVVERGGKAVRQFLVDLNKGQRICWSQTVLVVGQEAAGKSALCKSLVGYKCLDRPQPTEMSTVGIATEIWKTAVATSIPPRQVLVAYHCFLYIFRFVLLLIDAESPQTPQEIWGFGFGESDISSDFSTCSTRVYGWQEV